MALRTILASIDFSDESRVALQWAAALAERFEARVLALTVVDPILDEAARIELGQDLKAESEPALREFAAQALPHTGAPLSVEARVGDPAATILETAAGERAELIVMGTQGLAGVRKWLLGSTTDRVLRRSPIPVLAVPPRSRAPHVARIVAATDFNRASAAAVKAAARLAATFSAALTLVHVVEQSAVPSEWRAAAVRSGVRRSDEARRLLRAVAQQQCGPTGCETVVEVGQPAEVIGSIAQARDADLIVLGVAGDDRHPVPRPGAIAYRVLCSTTVPVLVVPGA